MIGILLMTASAAIQAAPAPTPLPPRPVQIYSVATMPGGEKRIGGMFKVMDPTRKSGPMYFYARPTTCESSGSSQKPEGDAYGWEAEVVPGISGPRVKWKRLGGAAKQIRPAEAAMQLSQRATTYAAITLDTIDGDARLAQRRRIEALRAMDLDALDLERIPEITETGNMRLFELRTEVTRRETELAETLTRVGPQHPNALKLQAAVARARHQYLDEKRRAIAYAIDKHEQGLVPLQPVHGCTSVRYSLVAEFAERPSSQLLEAELWFVHKSPDGRETSQRQAVRLKEGARGDFYFDDLPLALKPDGVDLPIVVEVFGSLTAGRVSDGGQTPLTVNLTRRYVARGVALGKWPKVGSTEYPLTVTQGEVISFVLPPLTDDNGILLGHRFSVRLRIKPVGEGET